jgi:hypothetical protein
MIGSYYCEPWVIHGSSSAVVLVGVGDNDDGSAAVEIVSGPRGSLGATGLDEDGVRQLAEALQVILEEVFAS